MALSFVILPGDGVTQNFAVPFPYISTTHVKVQVNNFIRPIRWLNSGTIQVDIVPPDGSEVKIYRETPLEPLVDFSDGSTLTAAELNLVNRQNLYISQEAYERFKSMVDSGYQQVVSGNPVDIEALLDTITAEILESTLLADLQQRVEDIDINAEAIIEQTNRVDVLQTTVDALADFEGEGIGTVITNERNERIAGDTALAETIALIGAKSGDSLSFILDLNKVKVSPTESLGTRLSGIDTRFSSNEAAIVTEQTTRATADSSLATSITNLSSTVNTNLTNTTALINTEATTRANADTATATTIALLGAKNGPGTAFVLNTATTFVSGSESLATRLSALTAADGSNSAAISSEASTRASADSALSSSITTLNSTVGGHTSSIATIQSTLNGVAAQYMVKLDVNGYVSGFGLYNSGGSSAFYILADKFAIVKPGVNSWVPFSVVDGVVYMQNVVINDALINTLTVNKLTSGTLTATITQNADINVGTGRIIWDNGTYMKVAGVGFGTASQFIEWFGPKKSSPTLCSEADAIYYLKTNGTAYFGGTLSAGTLTNKGQTTNTASPTEIVVGPFGTNGGPILVAYSYTFYRSENKTGNQTGTLTGTTSASLTLYRKIGAAAETTIATQNVTGTYDMEYSDGITNLTQDMSGSWTYTDSAGGTSDRTYRWALTSRSLRSISGSGAAPTMTQNLSVICTEA